MPIDTLWNNIWLVDDLLNHDSDNDESMFYAQPDEDGNDGSENAMGLVSGANVYIANTHRNGARNCNQTNCSKIYKKNFYLDNNNLNDIKKKIIQTKPEIISNLIIVIQP